MGALLRFTVVSDGVTPQCHSQGFNAGYNLAHQVDITRTLEAPSGLLT